MCWGSGGDESQADKNAKLASQNATNANGVAAGAGGNAQSLYSQLFPTYQNEINNPAGFAPEDLTAMNTAAQDSIGGSTAGVVGQGNLAAARTRNAGAFQPALSESGREGMRKNATAAVGIKAANAQEKEKQRQAGISGEQGLYDKNTAEMLTAMGLSNQALGTSNQAVGVDKSNNGTTGFDWTKLFLDSAAKNRQTA